MKLQNGGIPKNTCFPTTSPTSWAEDHIAITSIMGIGRIKNYSLCGNLGSQFMIDQWQYPDIGIVICDCPSAGHDVIMLDYRKCGKDGEPEVENCELSVTDLRRSLIQMRLAGWFDQCTGILFGRSEANNPIDGYEALDVYQELAEELGVPIVYDIDCGHMPPQMTFVNGARAEIDVRNRKASVVQYFQP